MMQINWYVRRAVMNSHYYNQFCRIGNFKYNLIYLLN